MNDIFQDINTIGVAYLISRLPEDEQTKYLARLKLAIELEHEDAEFVYQDYVQLIDDMKNGALHGW